jgi:Ca2+-binding EF-hand superfamily protein
MGITIDGRGPSEKWGQNAALFREVMNQQGGQVALMADTQVVDPNHLDKNTTTLKGDKALADVFDFSATQIGFLDTQDRNGQVSQNEFVSALGLTPQAVQVATTDAYHAAVEALQTQQPGPISVQQAVALQAEAKATVTGEYTSAYGQALKTFNALDANENGQISTPELANYIRLQDTGLDQLRQSLTEHQLLTPEARPAV